MAVEGFDPLRPGRAMEIGRAGTARVGIAGAAPKRNGVGHLGVVVVRALVRLASDRLAEETSAVDRTTRVAQGSRSGPRKLSTASTRSAQGASAAAASIDTRQVVTAVWS